MVPPMGHPDLILPAGGDAVAELRAAELGRVRAYCAGLSPGGEVDEVIEAAFLELRARASTGGEESLKELLRKSLRSAAAARTEVQPHEGVVPGPECLAMPELLAARSNGELPGDDRAVLGHLAGCPVCQTTLVRMRHAEEVLGGGGPLPEPTAVSVPPAPEPEPPRAPPAPPPRAAPPPPPQPIIVRRRSGGLVGAIRKAARDARR